MFLTKYDLMSAIELYQIEAYTQGDDEILNMAINTAIDETRGYLSRFDTEAIFNAEGAERSPLIVELAKTIALYYMAQKTNIDAIYESINERYKQATKRLVEIKGGVLEVKLPPRKNIDGTNNVMFAYGSNRKLSRTDEY